MTFTSVIVARWHHCSCMLPLAETSNIMILCNGVTVSRDTSEWP